MHYELHWFSKAGHRESIAITQEQFVRARKARQVLEESTNIERRLDIFLRNYADLEIEVAKGTIELTLRQQLWVDPLLPSHDVDRRLMNLLESASGYRWQVSTSVHRAEQKNYRDLFEERRKHSFAYRVLEALRNYSQHRTLPIHGFRVTSRWSFDEANQPHQRIHGMQIFLDVAELSTDFSKERSLLEEMHAMADKDGHLEVLSLVRHLVEDYSELNTDVRTKRSQITADARRSFQQLRDMVPSGDWNGGFLEVIAFGEVEEQVYLGRELETVLDGLIARNRHSLVNFGRVVYHL